MSVLEQAIMEELSEELSTMYALTQANAVVASTQEHVLTLQPRTGSGYQVLAFPNQSPAVILSLRQDKRVCGTIRANLAAQGCFEYAADRIASLLIADQRMRRELDGWARSLLQGFVDLGWSAAKCRVEATPDDLKCYLHVASPPFVSGWEPLSYDCTISGKSNMDFEVAFQAVHPKHLHVGHVSSLSKSGPLGTRSYDSPAEVLEEIQKLHRNETERYWATVLPTESLGVSASERQQLLALKPWLLARQIRATGGVTWADELAQFALDKMCRSPATPQRLVRQLFFLLLAAEMEKGGKRQRWLVMYEASCKELVALRRHDDSLPYNPLLPYRRIRDAATETVEGAMDAARLQTVCYRWFLREATLEQIIEAMGLA